MKSLAYRDCLRMQNISVWLCRNSSKFHCIVLYRASFRYLNDLCFLFHFHVCVSAIYDYVMLSRIGASYDGHCSSSCPLLLANKLLSLSHTHTARDTTQLVRTVELHRVSGCLWVNRARQLCKNISMLFLFPVKDSKLSTGVNATFDSSCYG